MSIFLKVSAVHSLLQLPGFTFILICIATLSSLNFLRKLSNLDLFKQNLKVIYLFTSLFKSLLVSFEELLKEEILQTSALQEWLMWGAMN